MALQDPLPLLTVPLFNPSSNYGAYAVPAVFFLVIQQTLLMGVGMVGGAINENTARRGGVRPAFWRVPGIVAGRAAAYGTIGLCTAFYNLAMVHLYYRYPLRVVPSELLIFTAPYLLSCVLLGLTISPLFRHREAALLGWLFTSMIFVFFIGFVWPPDVFPRWIRLISYAIPSTMGVDGFVKLSQMSAPLRDVQFQYTVLWGLTAVYFLTACIAVGWQRVPSAAAADQDAQA